MKCEIQWIEGRSSEPTPDANDAVALVTCDTANDYEHRVFAICACHLERMRPFPNWRVLHHFRDGIAP